MTDNDRGILPLRNEIQRSVLRGDINFHGDINWIICQLIDTRSLHIRKYLILFQSSALTPVVRMSKGHLRIKRSTTNISTLHSLAPVIFQEYQIRTLSKIHLSIFPPKHTYTMYTSQTWCPQQIVETEEEHPPNRHKLTTNQYYCSTTFPIIKLTKTFRVLEKLIRMTVKFRRILKLIVSSVWCGPWKVVF